MKHLKYLQYVIKHKWYVFKEAYKLGIVWRGLTHDLSKFLPSEWFPYVEYFYGKNPSQCEFDKAWLKHQKRNKHHWQWWLLQEDEGQLKPIPMNDISRKEMLADWIGAGKAITGEDNLIEWYEKNKDKMILHHDTRVWVEEQIYYERRRKAFEKFRDHDGLVKKEKE